MARLDAAERDGTPEGVGGSKKSGGAAAEAEEEEEPMSMFAVVRQAMQSAAMGALDLSLEDEVADAPAPGNNASFCCCHG